MKKLKAVLLVYVLCSITGCFIFDECFAATDCGNPDEKLPTYANKSGEMVMIAAIIVRGFTHDGAYITYGNYEKSIADGDTLHTSFYYKKNSEEWSVPKPDCGIAASNYNACDNPVRMELHFLNDPQKCLIFDGPIKNDGIDMRSWESYEKGNKIPNWADFWAGVEYVYTITHEHKNMATEEGCLISAE